MTAQARFRNRPRIGLRARITISFALGALLLSLLLASTTLSITRDNLLTDRESEAVTRTAENANAIKGTISAEDFDGAAQLGALRTPASPVLIVDSPAGSENYSLDTRLGADALDDSLKEAVEADEIAAEMRYEHDGSPLLAVGIPLPEQGASYFEITDLSEIESDLESLGITLIGAAAITTLAGAALGSWVSRRALRPLSDISAAAEAIAQGRLETRLDSADDAELESLVSSFNEMVSALEERIRRDARFASDVSHELRSPLMTLSASVDVLNNRRDELPDEASQMALDLLVKDVERFNQLVEDLLEISRFDAGAHRLEQSPVNIIETVRAAVEASATDAVPVDYDPGLRDTVFLCDKRRVVRVLANFLDNAQKYAGGATRVTVERGPDRTILIAAEDAGAGVPDDEKERIFDRFSRGEMGGARQADRGVGLGLALASEHAHLMGGRVWVEDRPDGGCGARFVFEMPIHAPEAQDVPMEPIT